MDLASAALGIAGNFFGTAIAGGAPYQRGFSAADIAGASTVARSTGQNINVTPGWAPTGHDGIVDNFDADYVSRNFGNWANIDDAVKMDLSADMNGDLVVDIQDCASWCPP
ncbi:MAG: hypothetical protein HC927_08275 [Deltaproteobacteria bacterium]|nr:hypothetical protein [Deltaproteobacteria bacterium]